MIGYFCLRIMTKNNTLQVATAIVIESLPNATFKLRLEGVEEKEILSHLAGKMRLNRIRVLIGDKVEVELDPYGGNSNRIIKRL